jgi:MFS family permease
VSNVVGVLLAGAMFAWFFLSALYMQLVLGYSPLEVGLAFLPANLIMGALSIGLSARLVMRFGIKPPLATGLGFAALGLLLFARALVDGTFVVDVLPAMILLGLGAGMAFNPVLLAAMSDVEPSEAGLASGVVNTSFMKGGALGLAVLASLAAARTDNLLASGESEVAALTGGYHVAFLVGACSPPRQLCSVGSCCVRARMRPCTRRQSVSPPVRWLEKRALAWPLVGKVDRSILPRRSVSGRRRADSPGKETPCPQPFSICPSPSTDSSPGPMRDRTTDSATAGTACTSGR